MNEKLKNIARLSNHYGADPAYVFLGGGNTSVKDGDRLYIKPSGVQLASIRPEQFLAIDRTSLARLCLLSKFAVAIINHNYNIWVGLLCSFYNFGNVFNG